MNINEWITKKSKQQWNNDEFEEYVGLRNGKWNGIIERIFVGTDEEVKKQTLQLLKERIHLIQDDQLALIIYHFIIGSVLDHGDEVVKEGVILYSEFLKNPICKIVVNDTLKLILLEIILTQWKELRYHCYTVFCLETLSNTMIISLFQQFETIYRYVDIQEKKIILQSILKISYNYYISSLSQMEIEENELNQNDFNLSIPFDSFHSIYEIFIVLLLMISDYLYCQQNIHTDLLQQINLLSQQLFPLQQRSLEEMNLLYSSLLNEEFHFDYSSLITFIDSFL